MSVKDEIDRISGNISSAYNAVEKKGGVLPEEQNSDNLAVAIHGIPSGGAKYIAGDGIAIDDNTISVTNPNRGIYTKKEFDLLAPEQQKSGTYIIADDTGDVNVNTNIYSTEEMIAGRWIDGRPIYRRCKMFPGSTTVKTGDWNAIDSAPENYDTIISIKGGCIYNNQNFPIPFIFNSQSIICFSVFNNNVLIQSIGLSPLSNLFYILEYTKTTDYTTINLLPNTEDVKVVTPNLQPSKSGKVEVDGTEYEYEFSDDVFTQASSVATTAASSIASTTRRHWNANN